MTNYLTNYNNNMEIVSSVNIRPGQFFEEIIFTEINIAFRRY